MIRHLRYGCNPHQIAIVKFGPRSLLKLLYGEPSYINMMDAMYSWSLVSEARMRVKNMV
jgi:phosphoribosylaminoimidazolecarboxamide formyltransferase/IMP cyclohydrolase